MKTQEFLQIARDMADGKITPEAVEAKLGSLYSNLEPDDIAKLNKAFQDEYDKVMQPTLDKLVSGVKGEYDAEEALKVLKSKGAPDSYIEANFWPRVEENIRPGSMEDYTVKPLLGSVAAAGRLAQFPTDLINTMVASTSSNPEVEAMVQDNLSRFSDISSPTPHTALDFTKEMIDAPSNGYERFLANNPRLGKTMAIGADYLMPTSGLPMQGLSKIATKPLQKTILGNLDQYAGKVPSELSLMDWAKKFGTQVLNKAAGTADTIINPADRLGRPFGRETFRFGLPSGVSAYETARKTSIMDRGIPAYKIAEEEAYPLTTYLMKNDYAGTPGTFLESSTRAKLGERMSLEVGPRLGAIERAASIPGPRQPRGIPAIGQIDRSAIQRGMENDFIMQGYSNTRAAEKSSKLMKDYFPDNVNVSKASDIYSNRVQPDANSMFSALNIGGGLSSKQRQMKSLVGNVSSELKNAVGRNTNRYDEYVSTMDEANKIGALKGIYDASDSSRKAGQRLGEALGGTGAISLASGGRITPMVYAAKDVSRAVAGPLARGIGKSIYEASTDKIYSPIANQFLTRMNEQFLTPQLYRYMYPSEEEL